MIDDAHIEQYTQDTGNSELNRRLADGVDLVNQWFNQDNGSCCMLDKDGLCSIQRSLGEAALCDTCRLYPRHVEEFCGVREWSLSLSCPEAARLILENKDRLTFTVDETEEAENFDDYEEFNDLFYAKLCDARDRIFDIIQTRTLSFRDKAVLIAAFCDGLQSCVDNDDIMGMEEYLTDWLSEESCDTDDMAEIDEAVAGSYSKASETAAEVMLEQETDSDYSAADIGKDEIGFEAASLACNCSSASESDNEEMPEADGVNTIDESLEVNNEPLHKNMFSVMFSLEVLKGDWEEITERTWEHWDAELQLTEEQELMAEQLMMFWIYTYFCGAVYDGWIFSKAMLAISSTWWILQINAANDFKGGMIEAAYRYAREIEHSDENLNALEEWFMRRE